MNPLTHLWNWFRTDLPVEARDSLFLGLKWHDFSLLEKVTIVFVIASPVFYLGIRHWITNVSILACVFSLHVLIRSKFDFRNIKNIKLIALVFFAYVLAIFISQLGRMSFTVRDYLDQSRWLIGFPFFLFICFVRLNYVKVLDWALPACILSAWISSVYITSSDVWGDRATVSFMDPLAFGFMNLSVALMCFSSLTFDIRRNIISFNTLIKLLTFFVGIYLSIRSGSRSGWIAAPVVLIGVFYVLYNPDAKKFLLWIGAVLCTLIILYCSVGVIAIRVDSLVKEVLEYPWSGGIAPDTSVGLRITFYRLGYYYFTQSPWFGWGERGYQEVKDAASLLSFSSQYARDFAYSALFHSEWITQAVRFGLAGLLAVFVVFFIPIKLFLNMIRLGGEYLKISSMALAYLACQLAASIGDEVFNSKGMITFTSIIVAGLMGTAYSLQKEEKDAKQLSGDVNSPDQ